ncbi:hypothetical protein QQA05_06780 [Corynebacterium macclintockiae]|nr:hypothetical protein [Corynebacterium macclintockiae]
MAFLRGGAWGNMTARARRVAVELALVFPLLAWLAVLVDVLVDVLVCVLSLVLLSLNCCAV